MVESPYRGLVPYAEQDAPFFFGRHGEREIIIANLMASRLTLLYGMSGVGKSSVLRAGVAFQLNEAAAQNRADYGTPGLAVIVFSDWRDDPAKALAELVRDAVLRAADGRKLGPADRAKYKGLEIGRAHV